MAEPVHKLLQLHGLPIGRQWLQVAERYQWREWGLLGLVPVLVSLAGAGASLSL